MGIFMCLQARKSCCLVRCCNGDSCTCGFLSLPLSPWALLPLPPDWRAMVTLHCACLENFVILSVDVYFSLWDGVCFLLVFCLLYKGGSLAASGYLESVCTFRNGPLQAQIVGFQN